MTNRIDNTLCTASADLDAFADQAAMTKQLPAAVDAPAATETAAEADLDGRIDPQTVVVSLVLPSDLNSLLAMKLRGTDEERAFIADTVIGPAYGVSWKVFDTYAQRYDPQLEESVSRLSGIVRTISSTVLGIVGAFGRLAMNFMQQSRESTRPSPEDDRLAEFNNRQVTHSSEVTASASVAGGKVQTTEHVQTILVDGRVKQCVTQTVTSFDAANTPEPAHDDAR